MHKHFLYIVNPISGSGKRAGLKEFIENESRRRKLSFSIFPSVASGDYSYLKPIISEEGVTDVIIAGGDGTVSQVVCSLMDKDLNFGILPSGSGNGLALAAGIPKSRAKAFEIAVTGKPRLVDGFMVNDQFACMLCGLGFDASVAHAFAEQPRRGLKTYATLVTKHFFSARPYLFDVSCNGIQFSTEAYFISIANSNQFGNHVTIAPKASLSDGLLDLVIVKKTMKPVLLFNVFRQIFSGQLRAIENSLKFPVIYFQAEELLIRNNGGAPMHIDGDPVDVPKLVKIKVLPSCFRLIQPQ
jgi:diacylglycerol kinase (ATP)